jgi:hypothetical protein
MGCSHSSATKGAETPGPKGRVSSILGTRAAHSPEANGSGKRDGPPARQDTPSPSGSMILPLGLVSELPGNSTRSPTASHTTRLRQPGDPSTAQGGPGQLPDEPSARAGGGGGASDAHSLYGSSGVGSLAFPAGLSFADLLRERAPFPWRRGPVIGSGAYGAVYLGLNDMDGSLVAVKEMPFQLGNRELCRALAREIFTLRCVGSRSGWMMRLSLLPAECYSLMPTSELPHRGRRWKWGTSQLAAAATQLAAPHSVDDAAAAASQIQDVLGSHAMRCTSCGWRAGALLDPLLSVELVCPVSALRRLLRADTWTIPTSCGITAAR